MLISPGLVGKMAGIGGSIAAAVTAAASAAVTYLLRQTFTIGDTALANTNTITGPSEGGTVESSDADDTGTLTVTETVGAVAINTNRATFSGGGSGSWYENGVYVPSSRTAVAGDILKVNVNVLNIGSFPGFRLGFGNGTPGVSLLNEGQTVFFHGWNSPPLHIMSQSGGGNDLFIRSEGLTFGAEQGCALRLGGFDSAAEPDAAGLYGVEFYLKKSGTWELVHLRTNITNANVSPMGYIYAGNSGGVSTQLDDWKYLAGTESVLADLSSPTGQVLEESVTGSTTFTHTADHTLVMKVGTVPSSGNIDIGIRNDWAIRITSAGALQLLQDYATTKTVRLSGSGVIAGTIITLRQRGSVHEMWKDNSSLNTTTIADNSTDTGGQVHSLGTGGAVTYILSKPSAAAEYQSVLEAI